MINSHTTAPNALHCTSISISAGAVCSKVKCNECSNINTDYQIHTKPIAVNAVSDAVATAMHQNAVEMHPSEAFLTHVRTLQMMKLRLKGIDEGQSVHISQKEIEAVYFVYPMFDRKTEIQKLIDAGKLEVSEGISKKTGYKIKLYKCLIAGNVDFSILPKREPLSELESSMMQNLLRVSLREGAPSTLYFDTFLQYRNEFLRQFFTVDSFAGRVHTPITNFHRTHRPNILIDGCETVSFDVATMQPLLLGKILQHNVGQNNFSNWINVGRDIYTMLQQAAKLESRDKGKKRFFELIFAPPSGELVAMFGNDNKNWIDWINAYKTRPEPRNPHTDIKRYSNLAWLLQRTEAETMRKVWRGLTASHVPFLSVHDEIICKESDRRETESVFRSILDATFKFYKLNINKQ